MNPAPSCRHLTPLFVALGAAIVGAVLLTTAGPTHAAGAQQRRLQIAVDYLRQGDTSLGAETGRQRLAQQWSVNLLLHGDGTPMPNNPLDPDDSRRQLERAQRTQQKVNTALARQGGRAAPAAPAAIPDLRAMQAQAQQLQARCGTDRECLMREASTMSAAQVAGGDRGLQARLQAYGSAAAACQRQPEAQRDACVAQARRQAGGGDEEPDEVVETPYLMYTGSADCQLDATVKIDDRIDGRFADVQGIVTFTQTAQAEQRVRDATPCPLVTAVLDTRNGRLWTHALVAQEARGVLVRAEKNRKADRQEGPVQLRWHEATDWLARRLLNLNTGGTDQVRLPAAGGHAEVKLRWSFAPA